MKNAKQPNLDRQNGFFRGAPKFNKLSFALLISLTLIPVAWSAGDAVNIYVAPDGKDKAEGTFTEPLASLDAARLKVRELESPVTVLVRGGEYKMDKTVVFTPEDSGSKKAPVTYKAYKDEKPVFTGGVKLTGWKKVKDNPEGTHSKAKGNLWYCDVPSVFKGKVKITSLYDGTTLLKRSRSGMFRASKEQVFDGWNLQPKNMNPKKLGYKQGDVVTFKRALTYTGDDLREWDNISDIEILISPKNPWLVNYLPLEKIDTFSKIATYSIDSTYTIKPNNKYYVENAIDHLDKAGEWVFNSQENRLYIWPAGDIEKADIRAPLLQEFILVEGVEDGKKTSFINFEGLTFRHGLRDTWEEGDKGLQHDWEMYDKGNAVLRFRHAEDCAVRKCTFEASGGTGVRVDMYGQRIEIADSMFAHLGGVGILLSGYAPGTKDENKHHKVTNNYLHHIGNIYTHSPAIFIAQSGHNLISHNTIHDLGYNGMVITGCRPGFFQLHSIIPQRREWINSLRMDEIEAYLGAKVMLKTHLTIKELEPLLHARENIIEYNEIYKVMQKLHDGNGIYFSGMGNNNVARRNYVHDLVRDRGYIRLDDHSGPTQIIENVGRNVSYMFITKGPCEYRNNFGINTRGFSNIIRVDTQLDHNLFYADASTSPRVMNKGGEGFFFDAINRISNSLIFVGPKALDRELLGQDLVPKERRGDAEVGMLYADPMLDEEAMKQKIFRFKSGSPAEKLGIKPIDLSNVGSTLARDSDPIDTE